MPSAIGAWNTSSAISSMLRLLIPCRPARYDKVADSRGSMLWARMSRGIGAQVILPQHLQVRACP